MKKPIYKKWWFWLILIIVVGILGSPGADTKDQIKIEESKSVVSQPKAAEPAKAPEPEVSNIIVTAETLAKDFENNEIKGNQIYKGEMVEVTGIVNNLGESFGSTYIVLSSGKDFAVTNVHCAFKEQSEIDKVAELKKGDKVTVVGKVLGKSMDVLVNDCKFKE